jgi:hypothetical protein
VTTGAPAPTGRETLAALDIVEWWLCGEAIGLSRTSSNCGPVPCLVRVTDAGDVRAA